MDSNVKGSNGSTKGNYRRCECRCTFNIPPGNFEDFTSGAEYWYFLVPALVHQAVSEEIVVGVVHVVPEKDLVGNAILEREG